MGIVITICGLVILLAFEMRHRLVSEQLKQLDYETNMLNREISKIKEELKKKKDIAEEFRSPAL